MGSDYDMIVTTEIIMANYGTRLVLPPNYPPNKYFKGLFVISFHKTERNLPDFYYCQKLPIIYYYNHLKDNNNSLNQDHGNFLEYLPSLSLPHGNL